MAHIGALRDRVTIQRAVRTADAYGGRAKSWQAVASRIAAQVAPLRGNERLIGLQAAEVVTYRVTIRFRTGISAAHRIVWHSRNGDVILNIRATHNDDERGRFLTIDADEGVPV